MTGRSEADFYPPSGAEAVTDELAACFGPRGRAYLRFYERHRAGRVPWELALGWSWSAFGSWFVWYWYRKLWLAGLLALAVTILGEAAAGDLGGLAAYLLAAALAKGAYVGHALRRIAALRADGLPLDERLAALRRGGGVSWLGAAAGVLLLLVLCVGWLDLELPTIVQELDEQGLLPQQ